MLDEYNGRSSGLCYFLHSSVISSLLAPNIFLSTLFLNTLNLCSSLKVRDQVAQLYNTIGNVGLFHSLYHGCARVAHCVTAWWRNFSHYCCKPRQYDVWFTCSEHREALTVAPTAHGVHKQEFTVQGGKCIVRHWTSGEATLRHTCGWGTWSVSPKYRD